MLPKAQATADIFWITFCELPRQEKQMFFKRIISNTKLRRDLLDLAVIEERQGEPQRSLRSYTKELEEKK